MAHLISVEIEAPPSSIEIDVDFYDENERAAFEQSPAWAYLQDFPKRLSIPTADLCAYYLYYKKRVGVNGFNDHTDLVRKWSQALVEFDGQVDFMNGSLKLVQTEGANRGTTERLGEAIGLSVASRIHGLHQADWTRIPEAKRKTLDFWHPFTASDGVMFVQVETKGSAVENTGLKPASVSAHKASIKAKKLSATPAEQRNSILYGTIGVLDHRPETTAKCWLVDPPSDLVGSPARMRVISRLSFMAELISFLGARSSLAAALHTRLAALNALPSVSSLNRVPLLNGLARPFESVGGWIIGDHHPWFSGKSVVSDGPAGGHVFSIDAARVMFIGIREELIGYAVSQDFDQIGEYAFPSASLEKTVDCVVPKGRFVREFSPRLKLPETVRPARDGYVRFRLPGILHYTQSGLIFGVLSVPRDWQQ
jgi:hypothetical protein